MLGARARGRVADDFAHIIALDDGELLRNGDRDVGSGAAESATAGGYGFRIDDTHYMERDLGGNDGKSQRRVFGARQFLIRPPSICGISWRGISCGGISCCGVGCAELERLPASVTYDEFFAEKVGGLQLLQSG